MLRQADRQDAEPEAVRAITSRLVTDYTGCVAAARVKAVVDAEHRRFAEARVRIYVPLLTERYAREALGRRSRRS
jgi:hypothetical protein